MNGHKYDDDWIRANYKENEVGLYKKYNSTHNTNIDHSAFNRHMQRIGLKRKTSHHYSEIQKKWLKENYPKYGREKTAEIFNAKFGTNLKGTAIAQFCFKYLKVSVTKEAKYKKTTHPLGSLHETKRGGLIIKTEEGWKSANHSVVEVPKGYCTINLDRDRHNINPANIAVVPRKVACTFFSNKMWSENKDISMAGILYAELYLSLLDKGIDKNKIL